MERNTTKPVKKNSAENSFRLTDRNFLRTYPKSGKKSNSQIGCDRCRSRGKRKDTRYWCVDCEVSLCLDKCIQAYYTLKDSTLVIDSDEDE